MQAPSSAPAPRGGSFAQNLINSQASQDATQPMTNSQPLTQSQLSMTAPSQPLTQTDLSQVYSCSIIIIVRQIIWRDLTVMRIEIEKAQRNFYDIVIKRVLNF